MKKYIASAEYKNYNANNRGSRTTDCVKRAISLAFNLSYNQISKELNDACRNTFRSYKTWPIYEKVIKNHGGSKYIVQSELATVADWIDEIGPTGTYILETGPKPTDMAHGGNHLTCVIDGTLYDSWDSSNQHVIGYYIVEGVAREFSDIQSHMDELNENGCKLIDDLAYKYIKTKYNLDGSFCISGGKGRVDSYSISYKCFYYDNDREMRYDLSFSVVFTPTTTYEEAQKILKDTIRVRMYDRFYAINKEVSEEREAQELYKKSGYSDEDKPTLWLTSVEKRFYRSLPGWVKPFVTYINIQYPGQFSDSYQLDIKPIAGDPRGTSGTINFWGDNSEMVKDELKRYKETFERPDEDYSVYEEY